ncbi:SseB family protein [Rugosimonospora africana]|uniref:SseB protein N-terminal domain-containing protein n=1 Tax=Rugosimonospora africana TaxID=556532 RepID=A0A8J3QM49_9ACTN|nr:SseB family protein [Rugosimonospora africana]GIH12424.1 hypothetical protein Raf01_05960 [Rugosimonospora africana]
MTDWEPATEAEAALRDALHAGDQELYFRILARVDLLLPVSGNAVAGQPAAGWGTWTSGGRTHVLAFTSPESMRSSLTNHTGPARRVPYHDLAAAWPNQDWWLAINPGLPVEGYLPAWFVAQLARGDVRLPGRTLGARARVEAAARVRGVAPVGDPADGGGPPPLASRPGTAPPGAAAEGRLEPQPGDQPRMGEPLPPRVPEGLARRPAGPLPTRPLRPGPREADPLPSRPGAFGAPGGPLPNRPLPPSEPAGGLPSRPLPPSDPVGGLPNRPLPPSDPYGSLPGRPLSPAAPDGPLPTRPVRPMGADADPYGSLPGRPLSPAAPDGALPTRPVRPMGADADPYGSLPGRPLPPDPYGSLPSRPSPYTEQGAGPLPSRPVRPAGGDADQGAGPLPSRPVRPAGDADYGAGPLPGRPTRPIGADPYPAPTPLPGRPPQSGPAHPDSAPRPEPARTYAPAQASAPVSPAGGWSGAAAVGSVRAPLARPGEKTSRPPVERAGRARVPAHSGVPETKEEAPPLDPDFVPANEVEANLLAAASDGQTDTFLSTLLLAKVLVPVPPGESTATAPGEPGFAWRREQIDGQPYVVVFTSPPRMEEHLGTDVDSTTVKFVQLIKAWPDESWSFSVNPGTPVGATLPGAQIRALAAWAAEVGLSDDPSVEFDKVASTTTTRPETQHTVVMQKPIAPTQVAYFLERGYDRVSGFVHRASEAAHLTTPEQLYAALGLGYPGSPFKPSDDELYVLRWTAYRPNLYRIPYGGRDQAGMRAMQGWVIERPPFRGNGFAPSESSDVIAEFKVDSARLPHGAQMWRVSRDGGETLMALLDSGEPRWRRVEADPEDKSDGEDGATAAATDEADGDGGAGDSEAAGDHGSADADWDDGFQSPTDDAEREPEA